MPLSTVKRESLIPRVHLLSIALLLTVAFVALIPSRDTFTYSATKKNVEKPGVDQLDIAYLKARNATGDLSDDEIMSVIHDMIRNKNWQEARVLMAQRPDLNLAPADQFLLDLETASSGFYGAKTEASLASYKANLVTLMTDLFDTPELHDQDTLERAAEFSADLGQPGLSSRYYKLLAESYPLAAAENYANCGLILRNYSMYGGSVDCFEASMASATDAEQNNRFGLRLARVHQQFEFLDRAEATLEKLTPDVPGDKLSLTRTAGFALEINRPDIAYPLYAQLADIEESKAIFWLEKAAKWAEASNQPGIAAEYVLTISDLSEPKYQDELSRRRQQLLIASGRNEEALATIFDRIAANPKSGEELIEGITLAAGMGMTQQAMEWNETLLEIRPFDIDAMARQIDFALASNRQKEALEWNKKYLEQDPYSDKYQLRLAQLYEWTGNVDAAMKQRELLSIQYPSLENDRELLRLAELNWESEIAANTLHRIGRITPLSTEDLLKLVKLYEQDGTPHLAADALTEMLGGDNDAMLLRELASLHTRHVNYQQALSTWEEFANRFGRSAEESLNRMELLWRLKRPTEAVAVTDTIDQFNSSGASQYQLALLSELGWRYRKPELVYAAAPYMDQLDEDHTFNSKRRLVQALIDNKKYEQAIKTAENLWRETDEVSYMLSAIHIALKENIYPHYERYLDATGDLIELRELPEYWLTIADHYNRNSDSDAAIETYRSTLEIQPDNTDALSGLIWTMLGADTNNATILETLTRYEDMATKAPALWNPYAVGYLRAKQPETSLRWFSKLMARNEHDYNILLSFADALEQSGNNTHAFKVRTYALQQLLPQVMASANGNIDGLGRDYISVLRSYGSAAENEAWTRKLLEGIDDTGPEEQAWRRELAASWYLATQRNDYARLVMTKMHERRLESPAWQRLAVALGEDDLPVVREILASSKGTLSSGDEILALRKLGHEREAYLVALDTLENSKNLSERNVAREHVISIRGSRPGYYSALVMQRQLGRLDITESGLSLRHTLTAADIGFELDYQRNSLKSDFFNIADAIEDNVAVTAHFGNSLRGGSLTTGINANGNNDLTYSTGTAYIRDRKGRRQLSSEVAINEVADNSAEFRIGARRDRAEISLQSAIGKREFVKLSGNVNELATRSGDQRISRGLVGSVEVGSSGNVGSNKWSMGVSARGEVNDREPLANLSNFLFENSQQVSVNAALFRGDVASDYPSTPGPRYRVAARLGHSWPGASTAMSLEAGAGFKVLGNDELSFQLQHDRQAVQPLEGPQSFSTFGVQYINHF